MPTLSPPALNPTPPQPPSLIFIFDSTRLRSHLFFRYLSTSPNVHPIYHPFLPAASFGPEKLSQHLQYAPERRAEIKETHFPGFDAETFESCTAQFVRAVASSSPSQQPNTTANNNNDNDDGVATKIPLSNEHWFNVVQTDLLISLVRGKTSLPSQLPGNPTRIPDPLFDTLTPVILIRHPIPAIKSVYRSCLAFTQQRPGDEQFVVVTTLQPLRLLYDFFVTRRGVRPVVVDGDDILWRTDEVSAKLCERLGLGSLSDTWTPTPREEVEAMNPWLYAVTKTMHDSSGIERPAERPAQHPKLEDAVHGWTETYGEVVAGQLKALVQKNMPHYEYLTQFKL